MCNAFRTANILILLDSLDNDDDNVGLFRIQSDWIFETPQQCLEESLRIDFQILSFLSTLIRIDFDEKMSSLSKCVEEFVNHHGSTLLPTSDQNETRRPRFSRFNSNPISSGTAINEDPSLFFERFTFSQFSTSFSSSDLYVITPPIEYFLRVSSRLCREQFYKVRSFIFYLISNRVAFSFVFIIDLARSTGSFTHLSSFDRNYERNSRSFTLFRRRTSTCHSRSEINCSFFISEVFRFVFIENVFLRRPVYSAV